MNPMHKLAVAAAFTYAAADHIRVARANKKAFKHNLDLGLELQQENEALRECLSHALKRNDFLCQKLDEADVPISEFDAIVYNSLI